MPTFWQLLAFQSFHGWADQTGLKASLEANPERAIELLAEHLTHKEYDHFSRKIASAKEKFSYEFIINPYQYTRQVLTEQTVFGFSEFLNSCDIWHRTAPYFYNGSTYTQVYSRLLWDYSSDKSRLASILNRRGMLSDCLRENGITPEIAFREWGISI